MSFIISYKKYLYTKIAIGINRMSDNKASNLHLMWFIPVVASLLFVGMSVVSVTNTPLTNSAIYNITSIITTNTIEQNYLIGLITSQVALSLFGFSITSIMAYLLTKSQELNTSYTASIVSLTSGMLVIIIYAENILLRTKIDYVIMAITVVVWIFYYVLGVELLS